MAAIAVASTRGVDLAYDFGVNPDDFYAPRLGRIFAAALSCRAVDPDSRRQTIAAAVGETEWALEALERQPRIAVIDERGHYSRRVLDTARARRRIGVLVAELEQLTEVGAA